MQAWAFRPLRTLSHSSPLFKRGLLHTDSFHEYSDAALRDCTHPVRQYAPKNRVCKARQLQRTGSKFKHFIAARLESHWLSRELYLAWFQSCKGKNAFQVQFSKLGTSWAMGRASSDGLRHSHPQVTLREAQSRTTVCPLLPAVAGGHCCAPRERRWLGIPRTQLRGSAQPTSNCDTSKFAFLLFLASPPYQPWLITPASHASCWRRPSKHTAFLRGRNTFASDTCPQDIIPVSSSSSFSVAASSALVLVTACFNCPQTDFSLPNTYYTGYNTSEVTCCVRNYCWSLPGQCHRQRVLVILIAALLFRGSWLKGARKGSLSLEYSVNMEFVCCLHPAAPQLWTETSVYDLPGQQLLEAPPPGFLDVNLCYNEIMISGVRTRTLK